MQYRKDSPGYLAKNAEDIITKQRSDAKVERADATSERLLSTTNTTGTRHAATDKVQRLASQRPLNDSQAPAGSGDSQQTQTQAPHVEFKEIQIKAVELDITRLRGSNGSSAPNKVPLRV
eukprot:TRINITY_DN3396_c0_g1_i1.p1 TRINITY_DN3396_c0_g1~~TRINITY_DN3396_c0_g1_i1.p1  ORF type:complete len:120 (-),score=35.39 TRINITY_DN3396_c0_g1_i1:244-603(-)